MHPKAIEELITCLDDEDSTIRGQAAFGLGNQNLSNFEPAIQALFKLLQDEDRYH